MPERRRKRAFIFPIRACGPVSYETRAVCALREKRFAITLPEEVIAGFGWTEDEVPARVREVLVIELLRRHVVSQRKAAELLHLHLRDLFEVMGQYNIPTLDLTPEERQRELQKDFEPRQQG